MQVKSLITLRMLANLTLRADASAKGLKKVFIDSNCLSTSVLKCGHLKKSYAKTIAETET